MIREINLENFKAFGSKQKIPLRPITLIYGPNSSGKSTIFNALLTLKQTYEQSLGVETSLLYKGGLTDQQNFSRCVNGRDMSKEFKIGVAHRSKQCNWVDVVDYECLQTIDPPHKPGIFRNLDGKAYLTLEKIDTFRQVRGYRWIDGKTILDSIEYSIGNLPFCTLKWIGDKAIRGDDADILSAPYPRQSPKADPLLRKYIDRIPDEYLSDDYIGQDCDFSFTLRGEMESRIENSDLPDDALEYPPYSIDVESISEEILKYLYEFLMLEVCRHCEKVEYVFEDFKKDILYNIEQTVVFSKHGNPSYYGHLDGGILNSRPTLIRRLPWVTKNELYKIYDFVADTIINQAPTHKSLFKDLNYVGPLRKFPERFTDVAKDSYSSVGNDGERTSAILYENPKILNRINSALAKLDLNYELAIHSLKREDLEAFGDIYSLQIIEKSTGLPLTLCDVGFGLSQVLPILVQSTLSSSDTVLIEQPEIHLHPKMQTELGDFFIEQCGLEGKRSIEKEEWDLFGKQFVIETHSEHLLLRIMRRIRETTAGTLKDSNLSLTPEDVSILYVEATDHGSVIHELRLDEQGDFIDSWPSGFFAERMAEIF